MTKKDTKIIPEEFNQVRIKLKHGSARVSPNASKELIEVLNKMAELAYHSK